MRIPWLLTVLLPLGAFAVVPRQAFVVWSSHADESLHSLNSSPKEIGEDILSVLGGDSLCQFEVIVVAHQPGLDASDLYSLPASSSLSHRFHSSPYNKFSSYTPSNDFQPINAILDLAHLCGSRLVELDGSSRLNEDEIDSGMKYVISITLPAQQGDRRGRKITMAESASLLSNHLSTIESTFSSHLVILLGSSLPSYAKRQTPDDASFPPEFYNSSSTPQIQPPSLVSPTGSLLSQYQILTPGLITAFLIAFGLLLPILLVGISSLASIQTPVRMTAQKGPTLAKKNQ